MEAWITPLLIGVVTVVLTWSARRGRPAAGPEEGTLLFRYGAAARVVAAFIGSSILGLFVLISCTARWRPIDIWAIPVFCAICIASFLPLWETLRFALVVSPEGLDCRSPWRGRQLFLWDEVEEVRFNWFHEYFVLRASGGRTFRVHAYVPGVSDLLAECERLLLPEAFRRARVGYNQIGRPFPEAEPR